MAEVLRVHVAALGSARTPTSIEPTGPSTGTTTPATNLPQTGSSASLTVVWVGAALVIVGLTALIGARLARRRN